MSLYTFYPCKADGTSETFTCFDLQDDAEAGVRALRVLDEHRSCSEVVVWAGARRVITRRRVHPQLHMLLSRPLTR
jgi:hypothetical protein